METTLHQQLKRCYADGDENTEVVMGRYRIDAIRDHELIEIQCASLSAIRDKSNDLLKRHQLRVVKPVVSRTRIAKVKCRDGPIVSSRMSPKRGTILDLFEDLIYFTRVFPNPNLTLEVPLIRVQQVRGPGKKRRRRWHKEYKVHDVSLESIESCQEFHSAIDLLSIIPWPDGQLPDSFNTASLAAVIDRPRWVAQQIAYVLRETGAIESMQRKKSGIVYRPTSQIKSKRPPKAA